MVVLHSELDMRSPTLKKLCVFPSGILQDKTRDFGKRTAPPDGLGDSWPCVARRACSGRLCQIERRMLDHGVATTPRGGIKTGIRRLDQEAGAGFAIRHQRPQPD